MHCSDAGNNISNSSTYKKNDIIPSDQYLRYLEISKYPDSRSDGVLVYLPCLPINRLRRLLIPGTNSRKKEDFVGISLVFHWYFIVIFLVYPVVIL